MKSRSILFEILLGCLAVLLSFASATAQPASPPLPAELMVRRSQPSVFQILVYGSGNVTFPKSVTAKRALLEREFAAQPDAAESNTDFFWDRIAANPGAYLEASAEINTNSFAGAYASGTAFTVSREGILLTNAHILADPGASAWSSPEVFENLLGAPLTRMDEDLTGQIGGLPSAANVERLRGSVLAWYRSKVSITGKFTEARIVLKYGVDDRRLKDDIAPNSDAFFKKSRPLLDENAIPGANTARRIQRRLAGLSIDRPKPVPFTRSTKVLACGTEFPGEDVAVLQVVMDERELITDASPGAKPDAAGVLRNPLQMDRLICLPLGNSDLVLPGALIHALGFPAKAFDPSVMDPSAEFQVSSRPGEIGQTKRIKGDWDAFEMTAQIDHGDSGGPVIDKDGKVIAINVWGDLVAHKLAVPINLAKKYLAQAGISPERGLLGEKWDESLRLYDLKNFPAAYTSLSIVHLIQEGVPMNPVLRTWTLQSDPGESTFTSPYVEQMKYLILAAEGAPK